MTHLSSIDKDNFEAISSKLDAAGNTLEYRKYADSLWEILITGGIVGKLDLDSNEKVFLYLIRMRVYLEPGGIIDASAERSSFCLFSAPDDPEVIKKHVTVFNKLIRRYKYLQKSLDDTLKHVLQFINKWKSEECNKLAIATGYIITTQLTGISVLKVLLKDYLVKDGM